MKFYCLSAALFISACSQAQAPATDQKSKAKPGPQIETFGKIPELMDAFDVSGLAITAVSDDQILLAKGFGVTRDGDDYTSASSCGLYSATKVLASLTYANLAKDDRLSLAAPLEDYIDDAPAEWTSLPFYRLLNHTSGITMAVNKEAFGALASNPDASNADIYQMVKEHPLDYQPGEYSRYRQSGYAVAEMILEDRLDARFDTLVEQYITGPASMKNTQHPAIIDETEPDFLLSAGGFRTTADDMSQLFLSLNIGAVITPDAWKDILLDETYLFENYSLGSVIEENDGVLSVGHSGGGARANIRYAPDHKIGVMVCTDDLDNNGLAIPLARMILQEVATGTAPPMPLFVALADYKAMTGAEIIAAYQAALAQPDRYDTSSAETLLNGIGYALLRQDKIPDALGVFALNAETYPNSPNVHDSYGEALLASGDRDGALAQYKTILTLDPANQNAIEMLDRIMASE